MYAVFCFVFFFLFLILIFFFFIILFFCVCIRYVISDVLCTYGMYSYVTEPGSSEGGGANSAGGLATSSPVNKRRGFSG